MDVKLCLLELTKDQADLLTRLQAPTAVVIGALALETVKDHLVTELKTDEKHTWPIRVVVTHFYLDWAIGILRNYQRPPHADIGYHDLSALHNLESYLLERREQFGELPFPELILFGRNNSR